MGAAVLGGLAVSTVLCLLIVPAFYLITDRMKLRLRKPTAPPPAPPSPGPPEVTGDPEVSGTSGPIDAPGQLGTAGLPGTTVEQYLPR